MMLELNNYYIQKVENLTDLQGKKATTTQVIIRDFLLAKEWN